MSLRRAPVEKTKDGHQAKAGPGRSFWTSRAHGKETTQVGRASGTEGTSQTETLGVPLGSPSPSGQRHIPLTPSHGNIHHLFQKH